MDYIKWISTIVVFVIGLYVTIKHFKTVRTISYIERMNNPSMVEIRQAVDQWIDSSDSDEDRMQMINDDPKLKAQVRIFYNLLTELAIAYNYKIVNKKITRVIWRNIIIEYWEKLSFYINHESSPKHVLGSNLRKLFEDINKKS